MLTDLRLAALGSCGSGSAATPRFAAVGLTALGFCTDGLGSTEIGGVRVCIFGREAFEADLSELSPDEQRRDWAWLCCAHVNSLE